MTTPAFAILYAVLALFPAAMHGALAAGAPWGRFTVGGRFPGRLPPAWRALALVQAGLLAGMSLVVLGQAGLVESPLPRLLFWPVAGLTALSFIANAASPSRHERRLWGPVTFGMVVAALVVGLL